MDPQVKLGMVARIAIDAIKAELTGRKSMRSFRRATPKPHLHDQNRSPFIRCCARVFMANAFSLGKKHVMLVPAASVVERGQLVGLYAVDDTGRVHLRLVQLGGRHDGKLEVLSGLEAGDRVVVDGIKRISEGNRIALPAAP
jgi:hypothetical protein